MGDVTALMIEQFIHDQDELLIIILAAYRLWKRRQNKTRKHRWWVHSLQINRPFVGAYHTTVTELMLDGQKFKEYFRLKIPQFDHVLSLVQEDLVKHCQTREVICPRQRLAICIRFLATGESFRSLAFQYRVGYATIGKVVSEVCDALWTRMAPMYMEMPSDSITWKLKAANFWTKWQFPHCLGALDGKHVVMKSPANTGSLYFNYKTTFSIVLLALVDADLQFICVDVGAYGRNSDGGIFANSNFGKGVAKNSFNLPQDTALPGAEDFGPMPHVIVADEAFPLQKHMMRPFPGRGSTKQEQIFNLRLSRARRIVENAFGILAARWRIYHTKIAVRPEWVNKIVKATCVLHNMLQKESTPAEITTLLEEAEGEPIEGLEDLDGVGNRAGIQAIEIRNKFKRYLNDIAPMDWQEDHVNRGMFRE